MNEQDNYIIEIIGLKNYLGGHWVHDGVDLTITKGEIIAIIGGSGCGKTTLLQSILMLHKPTFGTIKVFGKDILQCSHAEMSEIRKRWGVLFQSSALFSGFTVFENVMFPLQEFSNISREMCEEIAMLKIAMSGLEPGAASKYPFELSGGMKKRAALARAIALDPELIFLDEPSAGLDPKSADDLDQLILHLRDNLGLTFVIVTHDLDTLWQLPDRVVFLGEGRVLATAKMDALIKNDHPLIRRYFSGKRGEDRSVMRNIEGVHPRGQ